MYVAVRGNEPAWLFQHSDGVPLTQHQFWSVTEKALKVLGLACFHFGTRSFTIGAASTAADYDYPPSSNSESGMVAFQGVLGVCTLAVSLMNF